MATDNPKPFEGTWYETAPAAAAANAKVLTLGLPGIGPILATAIIDKFGASHVEEKLRENPYCLCEIDGIGFIKADAVAMHLGIDRLSPLRAAAAVLYVLGNEKALSGHTSLPMWWLCQHPVLAHDFSPEAIAIAIEKLIQDDKAILFTDSTSKHDDKRAVAMRDYHNAERMIAGLVTMFLSSPLLQAPAMGLRHHFEPPTARSAPPALGDPDPESSRRTGAPGGGLGASRKTRGALAAYRFQVATGMVLNEAQKEALEKAATERMLIVTGGPGTGKSTYTKALLEVFSEHEVAFCAPTARAAHRITEIVAREASTLHSLLTQMESKTDPYLPEVIVCDESSMVDVPLFYRLMRAIPTTSRLILLGDADQLPSVQPGAVLRDLIASGCVPVVRLTEVFRQAAGSQIIAGATAVLEGKVPVSSKEKGGELYTMPLPKSAAQVVRLVHELPDRFRDRGFFAHEILVLTPNNDGQVGRKDLNRHLQKMLNSSASEEGMKAHGFIQHGEDKYCLDDKVMHLVNDYERNVFNGDVGYVVELEPKANGRQACLTVKYGDQHVDYTYGQLSELTHAYAMTPWKAQGAEAQAVVFLVTESFLMTRNVLYTAMTRAKQLCVLMGSPDSMKRAVSKSGFRSTALNHLMREMGAQIESPHAGLAVLADGGTETEREGES